MADRTRTATGKGGPATRPANTPDFDESDLPRMKVDELRRLAQKYGVSGGSSMRKDDLVKAVKKAAGKGGTRNAAGARKAAGAKKNDGGARRGPGSSKSLRYAQEVRSPQDEPERPGRSLVTTDHDVIMQWAEARKGIPSTVAGTEHGDRLGVLTFDFPPGDSDRMRHVSWDEWFDTFDERGLNFIYQEERSDGRQSTFFRLENPEPGRRLTRVPDAGYCVASAASWGSSQGAMIWRTPAGVKCRPSLRTRTPATLQVKRPSGQTTRFRSRIVG